MGAYIDTVLRSVRALGRPSKAANLRRLVARGEDTRSLRFRDATAADIPALAQLHVITWNATYGGRRGPSYELRERQWREAFDRVNGSWFCFVIEREDGELVGFAKGLRCEDDEHGGFSGQLNKIYLLHDYQRLGLG